MEQGKHIIDSILLGLTWTLSIISTVTQSELTFFLATSVSVISIVYFIFAIREKVVKIKEIKERRKNRLNKQINKNGKDTKNKH